MMLCDFCSSPVPVWRYPAVTFTDRLGSLSTDDWLACDGCHELIEAGERNALAARSLTSPLGQMAVGMIGKTVAFEYARDLHDRFWRARRGPPHRIDA